MHFVLFSVFVSIVLLTSLNKVCDTSAARDWGLLDKTLSSGDNKELLEVIDKYDNQTGDLVKVRLKQIKFFLFSFRFYFCRLATIWLKL